MLVRLWASLVLLSGRVDNKGRLDRPTEISVRGKGIWPRSGYTNDQREKPFVRSSEILQRGSSEVSVRTRYESQEREREKPMEEAEKEEERERENIQRSS